MNILTEKNIMKIQSSIRYILKIQSLIILISVFFMILLKTVILGIYIYDLLYYMTILITTLPITLNCVINRICFKVIEGNNNYYYILKRGQAILKYYLTFSIGIFFACFSSHIIGLILLTPMQLLMVKFLAELLIVLVFIFDIKNKQRIQDNKICFRPLSNLNIISTGILNAILILSSHVLGLEMGSRKIAETMTFTTIILILLVFAIELKMKWTSRFIQTLIYSVISGGIILLVLLVLLTHNFFDLVKLEMVSWCWIAISCSAILFYTVISEFIIKKLSNKN